MTTTVAIVGRPNVGKSTLFNRLSRSRNSIVDDTPGVTRDCHYASVQWGGMPLVIIDTGGFDDADSEKLLHLVKEQVLRVIEEVDRVIFLMDGREGLLPGDEEIAKILRRLGKQVYAVVNKIDGPEQEPRIHEFYRLGVTRVYPISAAHGYGLRALMDDMISDQPEEGPTEPGHDEQIRVAVVGRPNAGKSSLINRILGFDRLLVSELPGTTRDAIDILFHWEGKNYLVIDTAGIKRKSRVKEKIEKFSMIKALKSLDRCHVAVVLLDGETGVLEQDARICGYALERGRGIVLAVNKWDLIKEDAERTRALYRSMDRQLRFVSFAPSITLSALTGERVKNLFKKIDMVYYQFRTKVGTADLNRAMEEMTRKRPPPRTGQTRLKFFYATQTGIGPPTFVVFVNRPEMVHFSYERFMINQIRERFALNHTPIKLIFRKRRNT
jgi:GTP-binding protein